MFEVEESESPAGLCPDPTCGGALDEDGQCVECGALADLREPDEATPPASTKPLDETEEPSDNPASLDPEVEFAHRRLCPDGACVGVIGADGRCKECGLIDQEFLKDPRLRGLKSEADQPDADEEDEEEHRGHEPEGSETDDGASSHAPSSDDDLLAGDEPVEFHHRQLRPDGACIGIVGRDGLCKECGRVA